MRRRYLGIPALLLAAFFFASQAFACCYANARFARALVSLVARPEPAHACCPKDPASGDGKAACAKGCCFTSDAANPPRLASVPAELPDLGGPTAIAAPAPDPETAYRAPAVPTPDTGPPVYLRTLRLLV